MSGCKKILGIETEPLTPADLEVRWAPKRDEFHRGTKFVNLGFVNLEFMLYHDGQVGYQSVARPGMRGNHTFGPYRSHSFKLILPDLNPQTDQISFSSDVFSPEELMLGEGEFRGMAGNIYERGLLLNYPDFGHISVLAEEKVSEPFPRSEPTV